MSGKYQGDQGSYAKEIPSPSLARQRGIPHGRLQLAIMGKNNSKNYS